MNPINKKPPEARAIRQPFKQQAGRVNQFKPTVAQLKNAVSAQSVKQPAPLVYRRQLQSAAAQAKTTGAAQLKPPPAPAVYRPQPVPKVLQAKTAIGQPRSASNQLNYPAIAPPAKRANVVQRAAPSNEEALRLRALRFAPELAQQQQEAVLAQKKIQDLRTLVEVLVKAIKLGEIKVVAGATAYKHNDKDPASTFIDALGSDWAHTECEHSGNDLKVTYLLGNKNTVTGVYTRFTKDCTVIHSGPTVSGVGYGTNLG
jgi:hypothetical protein